MTSTRMRKGRSHGHTLSRLMGIPSLPRLVLCHETLTNRVLPRQKAVILSRRTALGLLSTLPLWGSSGCSRKAADGDPLTASMARIEPLFPRKTRPHSDDWLATHREPGQTFAQYRAPPRQPVVSVFSTIRIVPVGPLSAGQSYVLETVADFIRPFFGLALSVDAQVP